MRILTTIFLVSLLWGCETTQTPPDEPYKQGEYPPSPTAPPPPPPSRTPASGEETVILDDILMGLPPTAAGGPSALPNTARDYLPFIDVAIDPSAADSEYDLKLEDHYTRIRIETLNPKATEIAGTASGSYTSKDADRNYRKESRGWLSRMFSSKSVTRTLLAEFDISEPDIKATEALFATSFSSSNAEGETWSTDQSLALYATPWFKVTANTTLTAKMRMQLADQRESTSASANVLGTLTTAANLIAPTSSLITYFNSPAMTEASNFLDSSVSQLFGRSITEQSTGSMAVKTWSANPVLVVYAALPDAKDIRKTSKRETLGGWAIFLDEPIPSMFTSATQSDEDGLFEVPDFKSTSGSDILSFRVGNELTVYDYIFSRLDLADRISALNDTGDDGLARIVCARIDRGLSETGFNTWDSAAGVWAAATSDQMSSAAQAALLQPDNCPAMARWTALASLSESY